MLLIRENIDLEEFGSRWQQFEISATVWKCVVVHCSL